MIRASVLALVTTLLPHLALAQVYKDLGDVELEYRIYLVEKKEANPVGSAFVAFRPIETKRGPRLSIESDIQYTIDGDPPLVYAEGAEIVCDEKGVVTFETVATAAGSERKNVALRREDEYHITVTFDGRTRQTTVTADVSRTNFGLFCAGYLAEPIDSGPLIVDYPLLFPVAGDHQPRQRVREATFRVQVGQQRAVPAVINALRRVDEKTDRIWNAKDRRGILLRMDENRNFGLLRYELVAVNGVPAEESDLLP